MGFLDRFFTGPEDRLARRAKQTTATNCGAKRKVRQARRTKNRIARNSRKKNR